MNADEFNEETRRERLEEEREARTLEDEIEDRESDIRDLHASLEDYVQRCARQAEALTSLRGRLRDANARNEAQQDELSELRLGALVHAKEIRRLNGANLAVRMARREDVAELASLRAEHDTGRILVRNLAPKRPMLDPEFIAWMDAHDRTEKAK